MISRHTTFFESPVMRELERQAKRNGEYESNVDSIVKKASLKKVSYKPSSNLVQDMIKLAGGLRGKGFDSLADELEDKIAEYKRAEKDLYDAVKEEDIIETAHPEGEVSITDSPYGKVETQHTEHKKILDIVRKNPSSKNASIVNDVADILGVKTAQAASPEVAKMQEAIYQLGDMLAGLDSEYFQRLFPVAKYPNLHKIGHVSLGRRLMSVGPNFDGAWGPNTSAALNIIREMGVNISENARNNFNNIVSFALSLVNAGVKNANSSVKKKAQDTGITKTSAELEQSKLLSFLKKLDDFKYFMSSSGPAFGDDSFFGTSVDLDTDSGSYFRKYYSKINNINPQIWDNLDKLPSEDRSSTINFIFDEKKVAKANAVLNSLKSNLIDIFSKEIDDTSSGVGSLVSSISSFLDSKKFDVALKFITNNDDDDAQIIRKRAYNFLYALKNYQNSLPQIEIGEAVIEPPEYPDVPKNISREFLGGWSQMIAGKLERLARILAKYPQYNNISHDLAFLGNVFRTLQRRPNSTYADAWKQMRNVVSHRNELTNIREFDKWIMSLEDDVRRHKLASSDVNNVGRSLPPPGQKRPAKTTTTTKTKTKPTSAYDQISIDSKISRSDRGWISGKLPSGEAAPIAISPVDLSSLTSFATFLSNNSVLVPYEEKENGYTLAEWYTMLRDIFVRASIQLNAAKAEGNSDLIQIKSEYRKAALNLLNTIREYKARYNVKNNAVVSAVDIEYPTEQAASTQEAVEEGQEAVFPETKQVKVEQPLSNSINLNSLNSEYRLPNFDRYRSYIRYKEWSLTDMRRSPKEFASLLLSEIKYDQALRLAGLNPNSSTGLKDQSGRALTYSQMPLPYRNQIIEEGKLRMLYDILNSIHQDVGYVLDQYAARNPPRSFLSSAKEYWIRWNKEFELMKNSILREIGRLRKMRGTTQPGQFIS